MDKNTFKPGIYFLRKKYTMKDGSLAVDYTGQYAMDTYEELRAWIKEVKDEIENGTYKGTVLEIFPHYASALPDPKDDYYFYGD